MSQRVYDDDGNEYESFEAYAEAKAAAHQAKLDQAEHDARAERVQSVINTEYDRVRAKFDAQISAGCDPRSGLRGVTHVPFEERDNNGRMGIDAAAAMQGNGAGAQMQPLQYGKKMTADQLREYYRKHPELLTTPARQESKQDGGGACLIAVLCVVLVALFIWMLTV